LKLLEHILTQFFPNQRTAIAACKVQSEEAAGIWPVGRDLHSTGPGNPSCRGPLPSARERTSAVELRTATTAGEDDGKDGSSSPPHWPVDPKRQRAYDLHEEADSGELRTATTAGEEDRENDRKNWSDFCFQGHKRRRIQNIGGLLQKC
jgi:hypothetical protein